MTAIGIAVFAGFVFCIVVHECAHALVASWCGDKTAVHLGRLTLNPIPHIDPLMSIILPGILLLSGSSILFGGAKPVPVDMRNLRHPLRDMMWVALAGPVSNFLLAIGFAVLGNLALLLVKWNQDFATNYDTFVDQLLVINLLLAFFNLIPIPPLDGSRILAAFLPQEAALALYRYQAFGMVVVIMFVYWGGTTWLWPVVKWAANSLLKLTSVAYWFS